MNLSEKVSKLKEEDFKQITGVKRATFYEMADVLRQAYASKHQKRGLLNDYIKMSDQYYKTIILTEKS